MTKAGCDSTFCYNKHYIPNCSVTSGTSLSMEEYTLCDGKPKEQDGRFSP